MQLLWALLKIIEATMGLVCLIIHIVGINDAEPILHVVFYCGTFAGFILTAIYGATCILLQHATGVTSEVIINLLGAIMHITASIWSMYHAEMDVHLQYLSDFEEPLHPYFAHCRNQSIASLACGSVYMMHCAFSWDLLITKPSETANINDENYAATQTLRLYFICARLQDYLTKYKWFRKYLKSEVRITETSTLYHAFVGKKARIKATRNLARRSKLLFRHSKEKSRETNNI